MRHFKYTLYNFIESCFKRRGTDISILSENETAIQTFSFQEVLDANI
jgi:hypothetical protein